jgi:hypothetical protein
MFWMADLDRLVKQPDREKAVVKQGHSIVNIRWWHTFQLTPHLVERIRPGGTLVNAHPFVNQS